MKTITIYKLSLKQFPERAYIGSTVEPEKRLWRHKRDLMLGIHHNLGLQQDYNECSSPELIFEVLESVCTSERFNIEGQHIKLLGENAYNMYRGNKSFGDVISSHPKREEIITRMAEITRNRYATMSESEKKKLSESVTGSKNPNWRGGGTFCTCGTKIASTSRTCGKCRDRVGEKNPFFGKEHSEEAKKKMSESSKGMLPINTLQVEVDGVVYESHTKAAKHIGCSVATISNRINSDKFPNYKDIKA